MSHVASTQFKQLQEVRYIVQRADKEGESDLMYTNVHASNVYLYNNISLLHGLA